MSKKLTQEGYINKAKVIHLDLYDYSKLIYINNKTKVEIICKEHGSFWQNPNNHLSGMGCSKCNFKKQIFPQEKIIEKIKIIHNNRYDYSQLKYIGMHYKVKIICKEHGLFEQTPQSHLKGANCPKCLGFNNTTEDFIKQSDKIHNEEFDYSKSIYIKSNKKIEIICKKHGSFFQKPNTHLNGNGCPKCRGMYRTTEEFILKVNKIHNEEFDYSKSVYISSHKKIEIICKKHGSFWQTPHNHMSGQKCPKCIGMYKTTEEYNIEANKIHNGEFDYNKTIYINTKQKIEIICKEHGSFWQNPASHLQGNKCPKCVGGIKDNINSFLEKIKKMKSNYDYSKAIYINSISKIEIICKKHGSFLQTPASHIEGAGCPKCNLSRGEKKISNYLDINNIKFEIEKKFTNCFNPKTNRKLRYDFYLLKENLLIEFNGIQHYKEIYNNNERLHKNDDLKSRQYRDNIKIQYAKENNIKLLTISYLDFNNIEEILKKELNLHEIIQN